VVEQSLKCVVACIDRESFVSACIAHVRERERERERASASASFVVACVVFMYMKI
jgi:hypothetical protein